MGKHILWIQVICCITALWGSTTSQIVTSTATEILTTTDQSTSEITGTSEQSTSDLISTSEAGLSTSPDVSTNKATSAMEIVTTTTTVEPTSTLKTTQSESSTSMTPETSTSQETISTELIITRSSGISTATTTDNITPRPSTDMETSTAGETETTAERSTEAVTTSSAPESSSPAIHETSVSAITTVPIEPTTSEATTDNITPQPSTLRETSTLNAMSTTVPETETTADKSTEAVATSSAPELSSSILHETSVSAVTTVPVEPSTFEATTDSVTTQTSTHAEISTLDFFSSTVPETTADRSTGTVATSSAPESSSPTIHETSVSVITTVPVEPSTPEAITTNNITPHPSTHRETSTLNAISTTVPETETTADRSTEAVVTSSAPESSSPTLHETSVPAITTVPLEPSTSEAITTNNITPHPSTHRETSTLNAISTTIPETETTADKSTVAFATSSAPESSSPTLHESSVPAITTVPVEPSTSEAITTNNITPHPSTHRETSTLNAISTTVPETETTADRSTEAVVTSSAPESSSPTLHESSVPAITTVPLEPSTSEAITTNNITPHPSTHRETSTLNAISTTVPETETTADRSTEAVVTSSAPESSSPTLHESNVPAITTVPVEPSTSEAITTNNITPHPSTHRETSTLNAISTTVPETETTADRSTEAVATSSAPQSSSPTLHETSVPAITTVPVEPSTSEAITTNNITPHSSTHRETSTLNAISSTVPETETTVDRSTVAFATSFAPESSSPAVHETSVSVITSVPLEPSTSGTIPTRDVTMHPSTIGINSISSAIPEGSTHQPRPTGEISTPYLTPSSVPERSTPEGPTIRDTATSFTPELSIPTTHETSTNVITSTGTPSTFGEILTSGSTSHAIPVTSATEHSSTTKTSGASEITSPPFTTKEITTAIEHTSSPSELTTTEQRSTSVNVTGTSITLDSGTTALPDRSTMEERVTPSTTSSGTHALSTTTRIPISDIITNTEVTMSSTVSITQQTSSGINPNTHPITATASNPSTVSGIPPFSTPHDTATTTELSTHGVSSPSISTPSIATEITTTNERSTDLTSVGPQLSTHSEGGSTLANTSKPAETITAAIQLPSVTSSRAPESSTMKDSTTYNITTTRQPVSSSTTHTTSTVSSTTVATVNTTQGTTTPNLLSTITVNNTTTQGHTTIITSVGIVNTTVSTYKPMTTSAGPMTSTGIKYTSITTAFGPRTSTTSWINSTTMTMSTQFIAVCNLQCANGYCIFQSGTTNPVCQCNSGFTPDPAQANRMCVDINECDLSVCQQYCANTVGGYTCSCQDGYSVNPANNTQCSQNNYCQSSPCAHGLCSNNVHGYTCSCIAGWEGSQCNTDIDECVRNNPCSVHGTCLNTIGSYTCQCKPGWTGTACSTDINECLATPCRGNGVCYNSIGSYTCSCYAGLTGANCETVINMCQSNPCWNGATCNSLVNSFSCTCVPGFTGRFCEININDCAPTSCSNGGICIDQINAFYCLCPSNFKGKTCTTDVNECTEGLSKCSSNAQCTNTYGSYYCTCNSGYIGNGFTCKENRLFEYQSGYQVTQRYKDFVSPIINIPTGFPFGGSFYSSLYFTDNGVIIFQRNSYDPVYVMSYPYSYFYNYDGYTPPMIAVFWADADFSRMGNLYYQTYDFWASPNQNTAFKTQLETEIKKDFPSLPVSNFKALWAIKITWDQVLPYPAYFFSSSEEVPILYGTLNSTDIMSKEIAIRVTSNKGGISFISSQDISKTSTYQAVLVTDGIFSFCLMRYADGGMNWNYYSLTSYYLPKMGYFSGEPSYYSPANNFPAYNDPQTNYALDMYRRYRPDQYIGQNTNKRGYWAYRLEYNTAYTVTPRQKCMNWYNNDISAYPYWIYYSRPCPCSYRQAVFDSSFTEASILSSYGIPQKNTDLYSTYSTFQSAFSTWYGGGTRCYYNYWGSLSYGERERYLPTPWEYENSWIRWWNSYYYYYYYYSYFQTQLAQIRSTYQANEVDPYNNCCRYSGSSYLCSLYRERRPYDFCFGYVPPRLGIFFGDPHINTLDSVQYTFNGLGEFILVNVKDENGTEIFTLQGRTARAGNGTQATNFVGLAALIQNETTVEWLLQDSNTTIVKINGTQFTLPENSTYVSKVTLQKTVKNEVQASFDGGISVTVSAKLGALSFVTMLDTSYKNKTEGLLGVFNDDKTDDLMAANGTKLQYDGVKLPNESLIFEIGMTWKTTPLDSIFIYNSTEGETWYTYNNNSFVPLFYDELLLTSNASLVQKANETCQGNDECIFDILSTGNFAVGQATLDTVISVQNQSSSMNNFPPNVTGLTTITTELYKPVTIYYKATDQNNDSVTFSLQTSSSDVNITAVGVLVWNPTSSMPINVTVQASDSKVTTSVALTFVLCNCTNNGSCLYDSPISLGNDTSNFMVAGCNCSAAWTGMYCEENFNACTENKCFDNTTCVDEPAPKEGFKCGACPASLTGDGISCTDINECYLNLSTCQQICNNFVGGYNCSCQDGYTVNPLNHSLCNDIDECANATSPCAQNANCTNLPGNYSCVCLPGYEGDPTLLCVDINECALNTSNCPVQSVCINTNGSFSCDCLPGYSGVNCTDINECLGGNFTCPSNSSCVNTLGSYRCDCKEGFQGDNCTDIDECNSGTNNCSLWSDCYNTIGSYVCACRSGYTGDGYQCVDINECSINASICVNALCNNTIGSYECICRVGFTRSNGTDTCVDINECSFPEYCKGGGRSCVNTEGSYTCVCQSGYNDVNGTCADINECSSRQLNNCSEDAICSNVAGSFICTCLANYTGDGINCTFINTTTEAPSTTALPVTETASHITRMDNTTLSTVNESTVTTPLLTANSTAVIGDVSATVHSPNTTVSANQTISATEMANTTSVTSVLNASTETSPPTVFTTNSTDIAPPLVTNSSTVTPTVNTTVQSTSPTVFTTQDINTTAVPVTDTSIVTSGVNATAQSTSTIFTTQNTNTTAVPATNGSIVTSVVNATAQSTSTVFTTQDTNTTAVPVTDTSILTSGVNATAQSTSTIFTTQNANTTAVPATNGSIVTSVVNATSQGTSTTIFTTQITNIMALPVTNNTTVVPVTNRSEVTSGVNVTAQSTSTLFTTQTTSITALPATNSSAVTSGVNATAQSTSTLFTTQITGITALPATNSSAVTSGVNAIAQSTSTLFTTQTTSITALPATNSSAVTSGVNATAQSTSTLFTTQYTSTTALPATNSSVVTAGVNATAQSTSTLFSTQITSITALPATNSSAVTAGVNATAQSTSTLFATQTTSTTALPATNSSAVTSGVNATAQSTSTLFTTQTTSITALPATNSSAVTSGVNATAQSTSTLFATQTTSTTALPATNSSAVTSGVNATAQSTSTLFTTQSTSTTALPATNSSAVTSVVNSTVQSTSATQTTKVTAASVTASNATVQGTTATSAQTSTTTITSTSVALATSNTNATAPSTSSTAQINLTIATSSMTSSSSPVTVSSTSKSTSITTTQTTTSLSAKPTTTTANSTTTSVTATSTTTTVPTTARTPAAVLFGYGPNFGDTTYVQRRTDFTSPLFQPLMGFPFGNQIRNFIYYTDNGQIVFPSSRNNIFSYTNPPDNGFSGSCSLSSIAVFWNDADFSKNVGTTYYQVYTGTSNNDPVVTRAQDLITKYMKSNYTAQWTLKITWENAPAYPAKGNDSKTNTYQALLTTDGSRSYVLMLYKDGSMNWDVTHPNPLMGFCSDGTDQFFWNDNMALNKYRPDNFVGSNSDLRGLWIYSLNSTILDNSRMNCLNWYNAQPDPSTWNANLLSCPCLYTQGLSDLRYRVTKAGQSTIISLLRSTSPNSYNAGVRCVYYRKKQFLEGFQERTWQFASSKSDSELAAYDLCCNQVENPQFCSMYKQMRPPISCRTYRPLLPAWMFGDPHITTLDGLGYTFNGLGDYILITASGLTTSFILQGRTVQTGVAQATNFNAFAAQYTFSTGNVTVEWYLENDGNISTLLNGQNVTFSYSADMDSLINNSNSAVFLLKNGSISATFGGILTVTVSEYAGMLSAVSSLPEQFYNNTKGLLGTWNNDQSDDFLMPNGTTIPSTSSEEAIYSYGLLWEVGGNNLFTFLQTTQTSTFKPVFLSTLSSLDPAKYVQLQTLCGNNSECIFDGMSTNNTALALATLNVVTTLQVTNTTLNAIPPYITAGNTSVQTFMNSSVTLQYTSNGTGVTFSADPGTNLDITVSGNGSLTWTPTSTTGFSFNLVATDSKNLSSTLQISFVVCNCVLSSECDYNSTTLIQNSSLATAACICTNNYTGDLCQYSPNLCFQDCFPGVSCDNTTGCGACPTGYSGNGLHCADIDECTTSNPCSLNALCTNTVGSYNCTCNSGFDGNGTYCADINECHTSGICPANAACSNTIGSYNCSCNAGFQGNGTSCVDIDECQINGTCSSHATCNNTIGSYICTCISGFTGNGTYCADINECQTSGICSPYATCTNTDGSYTCSCNAGLIGNGTNCADINECQTSGICSPNAACSNTIGSYNCSCNAGFQGNGTYCGDINECLINGTCSPYANCSNTIGSYSCTCNTGFTGNGTSCTDINECQNNTMCSPNATCSNTLGSYKCDCNTGFTGNGTSCFDIDECKINGTCSSHATCSNTIGSCICTCISGFTGNGTYCADINECQTSGICSPYATCTNTDGSYTCSCNAGLIGNGKVCSCSDCDLNYCSNGGTCQKSPPSCNPQCLCPPAYKDAKCVISGNNFQAALRADTPKRSMYFNFTSSGTFNSTDARSKVIDILTYAPINVVYLLFNNGSSDMGDLQAKTSIYFANFTAQFTYEANTTMITFLNDQLLSYITKNLSISTRAAADLRISNVASGQFLTKDQLLAYAACNVTGYTMNPNTLQCVSPCESYCSNDGVCSQIGYNVTCTCKPFSMYVTSGDRCDTLSMNLNAFFGILFGALAFLLLLILGVGLGIYYYRKKRKQNLYEDTDELYQTKFSWKSSGLPSFGKLRNKNFEEADTTPHLVEWKPHLESINTLAEVKIKRPDVKPESDTDKTNDYE